MAAAIKTQIVLEVKYMIPASLERSLKIGIAQKKDVAG